MRYTEKFSKSLHDKGTFLCVGIDPDPDLLPDGFAQTPEGILAFVRELIAVTRDITPAYKFNLAFFERWGWQGWLVLETALSLIPDDILTVGDAKRGDIGNSSKFYARALHETLNFDSVTLSPYLGSDSISPFIENESKGAFVLCVTSNPTGRELQEYGGDSPLYLKTADMVQGLNSRENLGLVMGATKPGQLTELRAQYPLLPFLIPGVGKQGGAEEIALESCRSCGQGLINVSRSISFPADGKFPENVRQAAESYARRFKIEG